MNTPGLKIKAEIYEDDGGGLTLHVYNGRKMIFSHCGYEHCFNQLRSDINALLAGDDVTNWDGNHLIKKYGFECDGSCGNTKFESAQGINLVAILCDGELTTHHDRMGTSAHREFFDGEACKSCDEETN